MTFNNDPYFNANSQERALVVSTTRSAANYSSQRFDPYADMSRTIPPSSSSPMASATAWEHNNNDDMYHTNSATTPTSSITLDSPYSSSPGSGNVHNNSPYCFATSTSAQPFFSAPSAPTLEEINATSFSTPPTAYPVNEYSSSNNNDNMSTAQQAPQYHTYSSNNDNSIIRDDEDENIRPYTSSSSAVYETSEYDPYYPATATGTATGMIHRPDFEKRKKHRVRAQLAAGVAGAITGGVLLGPFGAIAGGIVGNKVTKAVAKTAENRAKAKYERSVQLEQAEQRRLSYNNDGGGSSSNPAYDVSADRAVLA